MKRKLLVATGLLALTTLVGSPLATHAKSNNSGRTGLRATLMGSTAFPTAKGNARFRIESFRTTFTSEVEHVNLPAGTMVEVLLDGKQVGPAVALAADNEADNESHTRSHDGSSGGGDDNGANENDADDNGANDNDADDDGAANANNSKVEIEHSSRNGGIPSATHAGSLVLWETRAGTVIASGTLK